MSYVIEDFIIEDTSLTTNEVLVLGFLTTEGECSDTLKVMCERIGVRSVSTLRNTLRSLVSKGYVFISEQGVNSPTTYSVKEHSVEETPLSDEVSENKFRPKRYLQERRSILD